MPHMTTSQKRKYEGGCHCGAVHYSASVDLGAAFRCNCSICSKTGATIAACEPSAFQLHSGEAELRQYRFGAGRLTRFFCNRCGILCFARGLDERDTEFVGINLNTLENIELSEIPVVYFDGRHDDFEPRSKPAPILPEHRA
jgi:hypothetical protein